MPSAKVQDQKLVTEFVAAINSKDQTKIRAFVEAFCSPKVPFEERTARILKLANNFGPLTVQKVKAGPDGVRALILDGHGEAGTWIFNLENGKMAGLLIGPPDEFDAKPAKDYTGWTSLDALSADIAKDTDSPGITVALWRNGNLEKAVAGVRKLGSPDKIQPDDPFSVGSIGKPLCSTVIGKLIEAGKLRFDETLKEALPGMSMNPELENVTLDQIMHHRSGLRQDLGFNQKQVDTIIGQVRTDVALREAYIKDILKSSLESKPGARFAYSNAGYALLAFIAERATGKPYPQVLREMVFQPLHMNHSYIGAETYPKDVPWGHIQGPNGLQPANFRGPMESMFAGAGGGIYCTAEDLVLFAKAHLDGLRGKDGFLKAATVQQLHRGIPEQDGGPMMYACGWGIVSERGLPISHGHNGSNGTFRAEMAIYPDSNLIVVAIVNRGGESDPSPSLQAVMAVAKKYAK